MVYLNPADYAYFKQQTKQVNFHLELNGFIVKPDPIDEIQQGGVGLSSFQRDGMVISKAD